MPAERANETSEDSLGELALDNPIWTSLTGGHRHFALGQQVGSGSASRYPPAMGPFAGTRNKTTDDLADLAQLMPTGETAALLFDDHPVLPSNWAVLRTLSLVQMIHRTEARDPSSGHPIVQLSSSDIPEMLSLAKLTEPGPFSNETARLGDFYGIRIGGQLIAMAGQRFRPKVHVEVSAVCTHPNHRGPGLAGELVSKVVAQIHSHGAVPFLTCMTENTAAIRLYESLGFSYRRSFMLAVLRRRNEAGVKS